MHFGDWEVRPGTRATIALPVARLYTHTALTMPVHVVRGRKAGPRLFVSSGVHGDELNGVEIVRRLLRRKALARIRGTLIALPVVNVYGFLGQSRYLPDRRDLNRSFPGKERGSLAAQVAHLFMTEIVAKCTHGIDLHTGSHHRVNLPQIRASLADARTLGLARAFGAPVILDVSARDGSLREAAAELGIPTLVYEGGEALRFNEVVIRAGLRGIINIMRAIGMLPPARRARTTGVEPYVARESKWVRAPASGMLHLSVQLGDKVERAQMLGRVIDPFGAEDEHVVAPAAGIVIGRLNNPLVHRGDALLHVACFDNTDLVEESLEAFQDEYFPEG